MPTYEYQCQNCGEAFEYFHGISEPPKTTCEKCGGVLQKLLSPGAGLIFKGSGFYITDYKKDSGSGASASSSEKKADTADSGSKTESGPKTESKSAASTESTSSTKKAD